MDTRSPQLGLACRGSASCVAGGRRPGSADGGRIAAAGDDKDKGNEIEIRGRLRRSPAGRRPRRDAGDDHPRDRPGHPERPGLAGPHAERRRLVRQRHLPRQHRRDQPGRPGLHGLGLEPRAAGPTAAQIDKALTYVMENTSPVGLHRRRRLVDPRADVLARLRHALPGRGLRDDPPARDPREAPEGRPPDHRHPEQRGGLALSAGPPRRRPLGDDLPDQRPPRRQERRALRPQGDGRGLHPLRQAVAEPRRRLPLHAPGGCQRLPPLGRGRGRASQRGGTTPRRSATGSPT